MDTQEHITEDELLEGVTGQTFSVDIEAHLEEGGTSWNAKGNARFSITKNGQDWVDTEYTVKAYDNEPENAYATIMLAISNFFDDAGMTELQKKLENLEA
jgi:hypothetical protein